MATVLVYIILVSAWGDSLVWKTPYSVIIVSVRRHLFAIKKIFCYSTLAATGRTVSGRQCVFPFRFRGQTYTSCVTIFPDRAPWCALIPDLDREPNRWENCEMVPCNRPPGPPGPPLPPGPPGPTVPTRPFVTPTTLRPGPYCGASRFPWASMYIFNTLRPR